MISNLDHLVVRDFVDQRERDGVQGSTIAANLGPEDVHSILDGVL